MRKITCLFLFMVPLAGYSQSHYLLAGTYDSPGGGGIHVFSFDTAGGKTRSISNVNSSNASFLTVSPDERFVYAVQETSSPEGLGGKLRAMAFHKPTGTLYPLNEQYTWGGHPCHVISDRTGRFIFAANYSGGSLCRFPVLPDGSLGPATVITMSGSGPHARQKVPHVHGNTIHPGNEWLVTTDLGTDSIHVFSFHAETGTLLKNKKGSARAVPGSGPRLSAFRPGGRTLYVIEELTGTVSVYHFRKGKLKPGQRISTMIAGDSSFAGSAHLEVSRDGKFLYASNRGTANNIAIFSIDKKGRLALKAHQTTYGKGPRYFSIEPSGKFLLVANQQSDEIVIFERDPETGMLTDTNQRISVLKPVCLQWISR